MQMPDLLFLVLMRAPAEPVAADADVPALRPAAAVTERKNCQTDSGACGFGRAEWLPLRLP